MPSLYIAGMLGIILLISQVSCVCWLLLDGERSRLRYAVRTSYFFSLFCLNVIVSDL